MDESRAGHIQNEKRRTNTQRKWAKALIREGLYDPRSIRTVNDRGVKKMRQCEGKQTGLLHTS